MRKIVCSFLFLGLCLYNLETSTLANSYGFSAYGVGVSGARTASVADWTSVYFNVAGLANPFDLTSNSLLIRLKEGEETERDTVEVGLGYAHQLSFLSIIPDFSHLHSVADSRTFTSADAKQTFINDFKKQINQNISEVFGSSDFYQSGIIEIGLNLNLNGLIKMPFDVPLTFGLALSVQNTLGLAGISQLQVDHYNFLKYGNAAESFSILAGMATQLWKDRLSVGIGASLSATGQGRIDLTDVAITPNQQYPNQTISLNLNLRVAPTVGIIYHQPIKTKRLLIGFSFRGENYLNITPLRANASLLQTLIPTLQLLLTISQFYVPHTMILGFSSDVYSGLILSVDLDIQLWSRYNIPAYVNNFYSNFATAEATRANVSANEILSAYSLPKFRDIYIPKLGIEYSPNHAVEISVPIWIRFGYAYEQAIVDVSTNQVNYLDNEKHKFSTGLRVVIPENKIIKSHIEIDFGFQYHLAVNRTSNKVYTSWENNSLSDRSLPNPSYTFGGHVIVMSLSTAFKF